MNTRALHGLTANRIADDAIALEYNLYTDSGDGSDEISTVVVVLKGSVVALQPKDIERLERAGIICKNGVTIVIAECPKTQPERIVHDGNVYRVVNWAFDFSYELGSEEYGTVIATCDFISIEESPGGSGSDD